LNTFLPVNLLQKITKSFDASEMQVGVKKIAKKSFGMQHGHQRGRKGRKQFATFTRTELEKPIGRHKRD
jgi:hypothetical protein